MTMESSPSVATFLIFFVNVIAAAKLNLVLYDNVSPGSKLLCNDGSPGGYYWREALEDASPLDRNLWVFHQEGGGWCFDEKSCIHRFANMWQDKHPLVSSVNWESSKERFLALKVHRGESIFPLDKDEIFMATILCFHLCRIMKKVSLTW